MRIRDLRKARGWTLEQAGERMGVDSKHLWKIEHAYQGAGMTLATLFRVADGLQVDLAELVAGDRPVNRDLPFELFVNVEPADRYVTAVPLLELEAAVSAHGHIHVVQPLGWVKPTTRHPLSAGMFVARVAGRSMEPVIQADAYALFASPVSGARDGRIVLANHHAIFDPDYNGSFTIKRYSSESQLDRDGVQRHEKVILVPANPAYDPVVVVAATARDVHVIAEFIEVLA